MARRVTLDHAGMAELLRSPGVLAAVVEQAEAVKGVAEAAPEIVRHGMPVQTSSGQTDRAIAGVTIAHAGGLGVQAKYGTLSKAVSAVGLSARRVRRRRG